MKVYVVEYRYGITGKSSIVLFETEASARKHFENKAKDIKESWDYEECVEDGYLDSWDITDNCVEFWSRDDQGDDDFYESVHMYEQEVLK